MKKETSHNKIHLIYQSDLLDILAETELSYSRIVSNQTTVYVEIFLDDTSMDFLKSTNNDMQDLTSSYYSLHGGLGINLIISHKFIFGLKAQYGQSIYTLNSLSSREPQLNQINALTVFYINL